MLTGSSSAALLLISPLAKERAARDSPPFSLWSSLPTLLTVPSSGGGPAPSAPTSVAVPNSAAATPSPTPPPPMDRVCPYPHRDSLLQQRPDCGPLPPAITTTAPTTTLPMFHQQLPQQTETSPPYSLDFERLRATVGRLESSGWYYGQLSWQQATALLERQPLGTFLLRDSSDPLFLFALSVQTERGPTSIRIHYRDGQFQLDAEERLNANMPFFECVVALVDHYVRLSQTDKAKGHVWLDFFGRRDLRVRLGAPLCHRVPTLQHLSRLTINAQVPVQRLGELDLPRVLRRYLLDYPYRR